MATVGEAVRIVEAPLVQIFSEIAEAQEWIKLACDLGWNRFSILYRQWPPKSGSVSRPMVIQKPPAPEKPDLNHALALAVRALAETRAEKKECDKGFAERLERLQNDIARLSNDILTGQDLLPLES